MSFIEEVRKAVGPIHSEMTIKLISEKMNEKGTELDLSEITGIVSKVFEEEIADGKLSKENFLETVKKLYFLV